MTRILFLLCCLAGISLSAQRPEISVLGLMHLHNPGRDAVNADMGDIRSPQRQAELKQVVDLVARFKPTKIAFEFERGDTLWSQHYYRAWQKGRLEAVIDPEDEYLLTSEIVQLAYPLAQAAGLDHLEPIDAFTLSRYHRTPEGEITDELEDTESWFTKSFSDFIQIGRRDEWAIIDLRGLRESVYYWRKYAVNDRVLEYFDRYDIVLIAPTEVEGEKNY